MKTLTSGNLRIPRLGFGTFRMPGDECQAVVETALEVGYRHLDNAAMYDNEAAVGRAIQGAGIDRRDLFVTTKVWHDQLAPRAIEQSLETSLEKLALDYLDLFMVHWPTPAMDMPFIMATLMALEKSGRVRGIGVCNFTMPMLRHAIDDLGAPIAAVQVEYHPFLPQTRLLDFLLDRDIPLVAYAPLAQGRAAHDPVLARIGDKHQATAAQVAIAWLLDQDGVIAVPKARRPECQRANLEALAIKLDAEDRAAIAALPKNLRYVQPPFAPAWDAD